MMIPDPSPAADPAPAAATRRAKFIGVRPSLSAPLPTFRRSLAAVIGVNGYNGAIPALHTAALDATALARRLLLDHGYDVLLLVDDAPGQALAASLADDARVRVQRVHQGSLSVAILPDQQQLFLLGQANKDALTDLLQLQLPSLLTPDDRLLVYFAGHGITLNRQGEDGPEGFLLPVDAAVVPDLLDTEKSKFLPMEGFFHDLAQLPCRHLLAVLDCCFAGAGRFFSAGDARTPPARLYREHYEQFVRSPARQAIGSAAYNQEAYEIGRGYKVGAREAQAQADDRPDQHSPFALALFDALDGGADGFRRDTGQRDSARADGIITATELFHYVKYRVAEMTRDQAGLVQEPELMTLRRHEDGEYLITWPERALNLDMAPADYTTHSPWQGDQPYTEEDARLFYGREEVIRELLTRIAEQPVTVVVGPSSSGKTSLLRAGVAARLQGTGGRDRGTGDAAWEVVGVWKAEPPLAAVAGALARHPVLSQLQPPDEAQLRADSGALAGLVQRWAQTHPHAQLLLAFDALDRALAAGDEAGNRQFWALLEQALTSPSDRFRLLAAIRSAHEPELQQWPSLAGRWEAARFDLAFAEDAERKPTPRLQDANLRAAIDGPASERILIFQPHELLNTVVSHVGDAPGALACLSLTMSALYRRFKDSGRDDRALSLADYEKLRGYVSRKATADQKEVVELAANGVSGVLCARATDLYRELEKEPEAAAAMRRLFLRLVAAEGSETPWRRLSETELVYADEAETRQMQAVKDRLLDARLLVQDYDPALGVYLEPAHPALMRDWRLLQEWRREAGDDLALMPRLAQAAAEWSKAEPAVQPKLLWEDSPRLTQAEEMLWPTGGRGEGFVGRLRWEWRVLFPKIETPPRAGWPNRTEVKFVHDSVGARASFRQRLLGAVTVFVLVVMLLGGLAWWLRGIAVANEQIAKMKRAEAELAARRAQSGELAAQSRLAFSEAALPAGLLLATEAYTLSRATPQFYAQQALQTLYDDLEKTGGRPQSLSGKAAFQMAVSPDGKWLATGSTDNHVRLWAVQQLWDDPHIEPRVIGSHDRDHVVTTVAFSPDSAWLATGSTDGVVGLWPVEADDATRGITMSLPTGQDHTLGIRSIIFSSKGKWMAVVDTGGNIWFYGDHSLPQTPDPMPRFGLSAARWGVNTEAVPPAAFSPDEAILAVASLSNTAWLWRLDDLNINPESVPITVTLTAGGPATSVMFSPDGNWLATTNNGDGVHLWSIETLSQEAPDSHATRVQPVVTERAGQGVAFSHDGQWLAVRSDADVSLWDLTTLPKTIRATGILRTLMSPFDLQASASIEAFAEQTPLRLLPMEHTTSLEFSDVANTLLAGDAQGMLTMWNLTTGEDGSTSPRITLRAHEGAIAEIRAITGRDWAITRSESDNIRLWQLNNPQAEAGIVSRDEKTAAFDVVVSPDGHWIATGSNDNEGRLWSTTQLWQDPLVKSIPIGRHQEGQAVMTVAFSSDSAWLAEGSLDGTIGLWSLATIKANDRANPILVAVSVRNNLSAVRM